MRIERFSFVLVFLTGIMGCGNDTAPLPKADVARGSLEAGLTAWKEGRPASSLTDGKPAIDFVDYQWKAGKKLSAFTIGADETAEGTHAIAVGLTIDGQPEKQVQYMVLGLDPVHIFRDEDYARTLNMDNSPGDLTKKKGRR